MGPGLRRVPQPRSGQTDSLSPDSADAARGQRPGHDLRALLHEAPHREPEAVAQRVLILQDVGACPQARVRVIPLVGAQPVERHKGWERKGEKQERDTVIGRDERRGEKNRGQERDKDEQHMEQQRDSGGNRGERQKEWEGERSERTTEKKSHREETQRQSQKGRGGCRESKAPSGGPGWSRWMSESSGVETPPPHPSFPGSR